MTTVTTPLRASGQDSTKGEMSEVRVAMEVVAAGGAGQVEPLTPSKTTGPLLESSPLLPCQLCGPKTSSKNMIRRRMVAIDADRLLVYLRANDVTVHQIMSTKDGSLIVFLEGNLGQYDRARHHVRNLLYDLDAVTGYGIKRMTPGMMKIIRGYTEEEFDESPLDADGPRTSDG